LPEGARLLDQEGAGEVQTPVAYAGPEKLSYGDPIFMRHAKAGELCERFNSLLLVSGGAVVDEVPTYRGEGLCFL
jgi:D-serine deaminase-like pyridoxal phosphate-dependent protein